MLREIVFLCKCGEITLLLYWSQKYYFKHFSNIKIIENYFNVINNYLSIKIIYGGTYLKIHEITIFLFTTIIDIFLII